MGIADATRLGADLFAVLLGTVLATSGIHRDLSPWNHIEERRIEAAGETG